MADRLLKFASPYMRGDDVLALQKDLNTLKDDPTQKPYYQGALDGVFGPVTDASVRALQADAGIAVDGIAGPVTRAVIRDALEEQGKNRLLKLLSPYMRGADVQELQNGLHLLIDADTQKPYYRDTLDGIFGPVTDAAVHAFQTDAGIKVDGIVGPVTRAALREALVEQSKGPLNPADFPYVDSDIIAQINLDLVTETPMRIALVKEILGWTWPSGFYIIGANLYKSDLSVTVPTVEYINQVAQRSPAYFTGGRRQFLVDHYLDCVRDGIRTGCCDCSGMEVGIWRKLGATSASFDATAQSIYTNHSTHLAKADLRPADCVFLRQSDGDIPHMGIYVGSGWIIEAVGGAYGIQLSRLGDHRVKNQMTGSMVKKTEFNLFGRPRFLP